MTNHQNPNGNPDNAQAAYEDRMANGTGFRTLAQRYGFTSHGVAREAVIRYANSIGDVIPVKLANRKFGVEIECIISADLAIRALDDAGVEHMGWQGWSQGQVPRGWKVTSDASLRGGGVEVVSPPMRGKAGVAELKRVMRALRAHGGGVNVSCGMHVHVEADDLDGQAIKRMIQNYAAMQESISSVMPMSRRNHYFARPMDPYSTSLAANVMADRKDDYRHRRTHCGTDRYMAVNIQSFPMYGTLEFRQHQGTLNGTKAAAWVDALIAMLSAAAAGHVSTEGDDFTDVVETFGTAKTANYLRGRREALA